MQQSDLDGLTRLGAAAHAEGRAYLCNPMLFSSLPMAEWITACSAWSAGWLQADGGRDKEVAALLNLRMR